MALLMLSGCGDRAGRLPLNSITPTPATISSEAHVITPPTTQHMPYLSHTHLVPGQPAQFQVAGASPGEMVYFLFSMKGEGDGPCAPELGGLCVELLNPQVFGEVPADASGRATLTFPIPARAQAGQSVQWGAREESLHWQANVAGGDLLSAERHRLLQGVTEVWKHLPLGVTRMIGPCLRKRLSN
jgi:hypothetical protein